MSEVLDDLEAVAKNFDAGWSATAPTMAALIRRVRREASDAWDFRTPTPEAYGAACKALRHWRFEAERLGELAGVKPRELSETERG